ncbi:MAG: type I restriction enzyme HsdR N-terminal domain-containing protein [Parachlamydiaceae bacterium]
MSQLSQIFCTIRKDWVAALPEELVRQRVLSYMIENKGFPSSLIAVEIPLRQLPHLTPKDVSLVPDRRADIICFANGTSGLYPLLLVECKAIKLSSRVVSQVVGYNHFVRSRFVAIINQTELRVGWYDEVKGEYLFINHLPEYGDLLKAVIAPDNA